MIYVTVGTMFMDFPRLIHKMDEIAADTGERVVVQIGLGETRPARCEWFAFRPHEDVMAIQKEARVIVTHAGIGCVLDALQARRPLVVVPRRKQFKEHMTDHQMDLAAAVQRRGWGRMILDIDDLKQACVHPPEVPASYRPAREQLVGAVRDAVQRVAIKRGNG